jgi:hypothetical protein
MSIDFNSAPPEIFKEASKARHLALLRVEEARKSIAPLEEAFANAEHNLAWVGAHPALADADKGALYREATDGLTLDADVKTDEIPDAQRTAREADKPKEDGERPKRKRRTKAEIEADRAREAAEKAAKEGGPGPTDGSAYVNPPANESDDTAQAVEGQGLGSGYPTPAAAQPSDPFGSYPTTPSGPVDQPAQPVQAAPAPAAAPPAAAVTADPFDPFGTGA